MESSYELLDPLTRRFAALRKRRSLHFHKGDWGCTVEIIVKNPEGVTRGQKRQGTGAGSGVN